MSIDIATLGIEVRSDGVLVASDRLRKLTEDSGKAERATQSVTGQFASLGRYASIAAAAIASLKLSEYIKDATMLAARVETLSVVMKVVGNNAGYTGAQMDAYTTQLKKMGITTQESMASLIKMAGAQMDLNKSSQLARVAQDAAVIGNINSSEAFGRLIAGIRAGETEILKGIGINVQFEQGFKKTAATLGKTTDELTNAEKIASRMNQVLEYGTNIAGAYESAMGTAGKQVNSMARFTEELKLAIGGLGLPAFTFLVTELTNTLVGINNEVAGQKPTIEAWGRGFKEVVVSIAAEVTRLSMLLDKAGGSLTSAGMLLFGPGAALGNKNSKTQFERLAAANMEYEKRYQEGEARLQRYADNLAAGPSTLGRTKEQEQASIAAANAARAAQEAEAKRVSTLKEAQRTAEQEAKAQLDRDNSVTRAWNQQQDHLRTSAYWLSDHEKAVAQIDVDYKNMLKTLEETDPLYKSQLATLKEMRQQSLDRLNAEEAQKESIKATSDEFKAMWADWDSQQTEEPYRNFSVVAEALDQEREALKLSNKELFIQQQLRKSAAEESSAYADEVRRAAGALYDEQEALKKWEQTVDRMDQTFHDGFVRMMEDGKDGWEAFCQSLAHTFQAEVADYIYASLLKPLAGQAASGAGGLISSIFSGGSPVPTGAGIPGGQYLGATDFGKEIGNGISTTIGPTVAASTQAGSAAGVSAGFSAAMPYLAVALGGYMAGTSYFGRGGMWNSMTSGGRAANVGMELGLGMSTLGLSSALNAATGGGLFGTDWKTTASGVQLGVEDGEIGGDFYTTQKKKKSMFRGSKRRTTYEDLDAQWEDFIDRQYDSIINSLKVGAEMMGQNDGYVTEIMSSFTSAASKINLKGKDAEAQQKAVEEYFRKLTNEALLALYPELEESIRLGEDAAAAWERLNNLRKTNNSLLMQEMELLGRKGSTEYMELLNQQRELELLNMDETTQAIQRRVWALEDEQDAIKSMNTDLLDTALSAANLLKSLTTSELSTGSPESIYKQTQQAFNDALSSGNLSAVPELGSAFLSASRSYNASGSAYVSDYNSVTSALANIAGMPTTAELTLTEAQKQVALLEAIKDAIETGNVVSLAGFSGQLNPDSAVTGSVTPPTTTGSTTGDATMQSKAQSIKDESMKMALGILTSNMQYDIAPLGSPDGLVDAGDVLLWQRLATGDLKWSQTGLPAFASGGITSGPSIAGEGLLREAIVPLPDGRTIPAMIADNYTGALIEEIKELRKEVAALRNEASTGNRLTQAGFTTLAEQGEEGNKNTAVMARNLRMAGAK